MNVPWENTSTVYLAQRPAHNKCPAIGGCNDDDVVYVIF